VLDLNSGFSAGPYVFYLNWWAAYW